jgi:hypothetical protein
MAFLENAILGKTTVTGTLQLRNGGAVPQATSITTGVTLNGSSGQITTVASTLAAGAEATFTVTNAKVLDGTAVVVACIGAYGGAGTPVAAVTRVAAGSFDVTLTNLHATAALDAAVPINFAVINGSANP